MTSLALVGVVKRYGPTTALSGYSLTVPAGRITAFVGANGAGKSTAMRLLGGLRAPDVGQAMIAGRPLVRADRALIGHSPEDRGLYADEPVRAQLRHFAELIGMPRRSIRAHVDGVLERTGMLPLAERRFGLLSLGNRQRAQLALALLGSPSYLLLDEPFSGLDVDGLAQVSDLVRSLAADGVGVLVSSHQLEVVAAVSDRVGVIADGRSVIEGDISDVLGAAERALRLTFRAAEDTDQEPILHRFAERVAGRIEWRAGSVVVEVPIDPGSSIDPTLVSAAAAVGTLTAVDVTQPSLRELLTAAPR